MTLISRSFRCKQITNETIKKLSNHIRDHLKQITSLALLFHEYKAIFRYYLHSTRCDKITDDGAKDLILNVLSNLKSLKHFVINFER